MVPQKRIQHGKTRERALGGFGQPGLATLHLSGAAAVAGRSLDEVKSGCRNLLDFCSSRLKGSDV